MVENLRLREMYSCKVVRVKVLMFIKETNKV